MQVAAHMCRRLLLRHSGVSVYAVGLCWMPVLFSSVWFIVVLRSSENSTCKLKHRDKYVKKYTCIARYGHDCTWGAMQKIASSQTMSLWHDWAQVEGLKGLRGDLGKKNKNNSDR